MKTLGPPAARSRFYTAQSHQPPKGILGKPWFRQLRPVTAHQDSDFRLHLRAIEPDIGVWRQQAAIVLGNLVLENEMPPEGGPRQFTDDPVVLVQIRPVMGKDHVRIRPLPDRLEYLLDLQVLGRKVAVAKPVRLHL